MAGANLQFREDMLSVVDNVVTFPDFKIYGANKNPIVLNGTVNAKKFSNILFDLTADADNFQLVKSDSRSKADLFGKVFLNLDAAVTGLPVGPTVNDTPVEYYTIQGIRLPGAPTAPGIYIRRTGSKAEKVRY